jgi:hypothetical protein
MLAPPASKRAIEELDDVDLEAKPFPRLKNDRCPICSEEFVAADKYAKRLPCGHVFHERTCLLPWLAKTNSCPMCRFELETLDPAYEIRRRQKSANKHDDDENEDDVSNGPLTSMYR